MGRDTRGASKKIRWFYTPPSATEKYQFIYPPELFI